MSEKKRIVVGLSGGVDSSVAAYLLKKQGHDVIGVFMKNWHDTEYTIADYCPWEEDSKDALLVAEKLGIPFQTIDFSSEYKSRIVDYMFREYSLGRTPNPDVLCNREIKFDIFLERALELGADAIATGHYCRVKEKNGAYSLLSGMDENKDQSYFLCQVNQEQLKYALFPIGNLRKDEVRQVAKEANLVTAEKKDSQGLCFIGKVKLPDFLKQKLEPKNGNVIEISEQNHLLKYGLSSRVEATDYQPNDGAIVGQHQGAHFYTVGQRKGLNIGGYKEPLFVLEKDTVENIIYVGMGAKHPGLFRAGLSIRNKDIHWVNPIDKMDNGESRNYQLRYRYRQELFKAKLTKQEDGLLIEFAENQSAIASGQFAAWYDGETLVGSGVIE